jgi:predicted Fe-Mo cluster-binding NifX family protein
MPATNDSVVVAIPVAEGRLAMHFGHCQEFALIDVNKETKEILNQRREQPPAHQPGVLPNWLHGQGAKLVIAGGMGRRAQDIFAEHGIEVIVGAPDDTPESIVKSYLAGTLTAGENICDH